MGGGKIKKTLQEHMEKGYNVVMEETPAKTIRDKISQVEALGIEIASPEKEYKDYDEKPNNCINENFEDLPF